MDNVQCTYTNRAHVCASLKELGLTMQPQGPDQVGELYNNAFMANSIIAFNTSIQKKVVIQIIDNVKVSTL